MGVNTRRLLEMALLCLQIGQNRRRCPHDLERNVAHHPHIGQTVGDGVACRRKASFRPISQPQKQGGKAALVMLVLREQIQRALGVLLGHVAIALGLGKVGAGVGDGGRQRLIGRFVHNDHLLNRRLRLTCGNFGRGRQCLLGDAQVGIGFLQFAIIQQRPGAAHIQYRSGAHQCRRKRLHPASPGTGPVPVEERRPRHFNQIRSPFKILSKERVTDRLRWGIVLLIPGACAPVQTGRRIGLLPH